MGVKSKRKGKYFESKVQKLIKDFFNSDDRHVKRNISSGTMHGEEGDISTDLIDFVIECKNREDWNIKHLLGKDKETQSNPFLKFLEQNEKEVEDYNVRYNDKRHGVIVFSKNRYPIYVLVKEELINKDLIKDKEYLRTRFNNQWYLVMCIEDFLEVIAYEKSIKH